MEYDALVATHNMQSKNWALFMGEHPNGRKIFCLDYDVNSYNKESKTVNRCEKTKELFDDYVDGVEEKDGVFMGSTIENGALIVDYTDNEGITRMVEELCSRITGNSFKAKLYAMEIFMGDKAIQILPPSRTKCKVSQKIDRARKWLGNCPFAVLNNDTPEESYQIAYLADIFKQTLELPQYAKKTKYVKKQDEEDENEESADGDKWVKLIMDYMGNPRTEGGQHKIDRNDFVTICASLKSNNYSLDVWNKFVALDQRGSDGQKIWDSCTHTVHRNTLRTICKKINPDALRKWNEDYNMFLKLETLDKGAVDIAKWAKPHLKETMRCYKKIWYIYDERKGVWKMTANVMNRIIEPIQHFIDESVLYHTLLKTKAEDEEKKKIQQNIINSLNIHRRQLSQSANFNAIEKFLRERLEVDEEWVKQLDNRPYTIAFQNGILDLKTMEFRHGLVNTDYLTRTIQRKYRKPTKEEKKWVRHELKKICNWKETHLIRYLAQLGMAMCGDASKIQEFYNIKGEGASNGKSSVFEVLTKIAGNYIRKLESNVLEKGMQNVRHKEIANWGGVRLAWMNELDEFAVQDDAFIKNLRDGETVNYNVLFGVNAIMQIQFKLNIIANHPLNIKGDRGILRSYVVNQFDSDFTAGNGITDETEDYENLKFVSDSNFKQRLIIKGDALLELIFEYSQEFAKTGKMPEIPVEWVAERNELKQHICKFDNWLMENFKWEKTEDDNDTEDVNSWNVTKQEMEELLAEQKKFKIGNINTELKRMKIFNNPVLYDSIRKLRGGRGVYTHIKKLTWEEKNGE
jgi:phage/plasmid-associated DNA primase